MIRKATTATSSNAKTQRQLWSPPPPVLCPGPPGPPARGRPGRRSARGLIAPWYAPGVRVRPLPASWPTQVVGNLLEMARSSSGPPGGETEAGSTWAEEHVAPATAAQGWTWMVLAVVGFLGGQVVSALLLVVTAAANGHLHDLARLSARAVPPAWV